MADPAAGKRPLWVFQGDFLVTARRDVFLTSVLGSCIAVCMRDPVLGLSGMNHFLLPERAADAAHDPTLALRYGSYSIERLTNTILSRGGLRERLEIKVFGGANVINGSGRIGDRNADFIERYFQRERLPVSASDLRGTRARKVRFYPESGRVQVAELREADTRETAQQEVAVISRIGQLPIAGDIEIF